MALIKCPECGHMVSDKATKCPKCGCPTKEATVPHQEDAARNDMPVYDEEESPTNKWLYVVIALLLAAIAGGGYLWYSQSKGNQKVQLFVEQFLKAVETGDRATIRYLYPYADTADSLALPGTEFMASEQRRMAGDSTLGKRGMDDYLQPRLFCLARQRDGFRKENGTMESRTDRQGIGTANER